MPVGTTVVVGLSAVAVIGALGGGFAIGRATAPDSSDLVEAQTEQLDVLTDGMADLVGRAQAPAVLSAELERDVAAGLLQMPPMCMPSMGGDPASTACMLAWCVRTGETDKQRCEPGKLMDLYVAEQRISERERSLTLWEQDLTLRETEGCPEPAR